MIAQSSGAKSLSSRGSGFLGNRPLSGEWPDEYEPLADGEQIICHESHGGVLRCYERVAA